MGGDLFIHITTSIPNLEKLDENERSALRKLLTKTNMTEYIKENNINNSVKTPTNLILTNIEEIAIEMEEEEPHGMPEGMHQGLPEGVQCAQQ